VATWAGGGVLPPALGIAEELQCRGHEVTILGHAGQRDAVEAAGLRFRTYERSSNVDYTKPWLMPIVAREVFYSQAMAEDIRAEVANRTCDVMLVDCALEGAIAAAELTGLPSAVLVHTLPGAIADQRERPRQLQSELRESLGVSAVDSRLEAWSKLPLSLVASLRSLDRSRALDLGHFHYVGPTFPDGSKTVWHSPWPAADKRPLILVSLSTLFHERLEATLQRILDALSSEPVRVLVTCGPAADPKALNSPENAVVTHYAPHSVVLPHAALVLTHGGHGTAMAALTHGLPIGLFPLFADQPFVAERLTEMGAGLTLAPDAEPAAIRQAVGLLLDEPSFRNAAKALASEIRGSGGAAEAADLLEGLLPYE
jgi:MGT family glycosyltransferase